MTKQKTENLEHIRNFILAVAFLVLLTGASCVQAPQEAPAKPEDNQDALIQQDSNPNPENQNANADVELSTPETDMQAEEQNPIKDITSFIPETIIPDPIKVVKDLIPDKPAQNATSESVASSVNLNVPFQAQAPFGDWDLPWQEACEEASSVMVKYYFNNDLLTRSVMRDEILALVDWQNENRGDYLDTTAQETADMILAVYGINSTVTPDVTIERMKKELSAGHLILIPASGRGLQNPNFSGTDPFYHMLVVRGYNDKGFITNDPGTRNGEGYVYDYDTFMAAIHDWTGSKATIEQGPKRMIIIKDTK